MAADPSSGTCGCRAGPELCRKKYQAHTGGSTTTTFLAVPRHRLNMGPRLSIHHRQLRGLRSMGDKVRGCFTRFEGRIGDGPEPPLESSARDDRPVVGEHRQTRRAQQRPAGQVSTPRHPTMTYADGNRLMKLGPLQVDGDDPRGDPAIMNWRRSTVGRT